MSFSHMVQAKADELSERAISMGMDFELDDELEGYRQALFDISLELENLAKEMVQK